MVAILENPLRVGLRKERMPEPQILVIFGSFRGSDSAQTRTCNLSDEARSALAAGNYCRGGSAPPLESRLLPGANAGRYREIWRRH